MNTDWCAGCRWYLRIARTLHGKHYCKSCAPHAHLMPITTDGIASIR